MRTVLPETCQTAAQATKTRKIGRPNLGSAGLTPQGAISAQPNTLIRHSLNGRVFL
jgi:hypothetical protein